MQEKQGEKEDWHTMKKKDRDRRETESGIQRALMMRKSKESAFERRLHMERREAEQEEKLMRAEEAEDLRRQQIEQTYKLAEELSRIKKKEEIDKCLELKRLKFQLATTCCMNEPKLQLAKTKVQQEARNAKLVRDWYQDTAQESRIKESGRQYLVDLQKQIISDRRRIREKEEEKQRDRKVLEEGAKVTHEEDVLLEERKKLRKCHLIAEKEAFLEARNRWKEKRKIAIKEEHKKIEDMVVEKETLLRKQAAQKSDVLAAREAMIENISRKMLDEEIKKTEKEEICDALFWEEKMIEWANEPIKQAMKRDKIAKEILAEMIRRKMAVSEQKAKEKAIDKAFAQYFAEEYRKVEEKEKQKAEELRKKNEQYGRELKEDAIQSRIAYAMKILRRQDKLKEATPTEEISQQKCEELVNDSSLESQLIRPCECPEELTQKAV